MFLKNKKIFIPLLVALCTLGFLANSFAQSPKKAFKTLSEPEKTWVYFHILKAKKAYKISKEMSQITDSILKTKTLGTKREVGDQLDAFKHTLWMWNLATEIGCSSAESLGKAHEKGNYLMYKNHDLEDGKLPDKPSSDMDKANNALGIKLYKKHKKEKLSLTERIQIVITAVLEGKAKILYQTKKGFFLNKEGKILDSTQYVGLWENERHLVSSNTEHIIDDNQLKSLTLP